MSLFQKFLLTGLLLISIGTGDVFSNIDSTIRNCLFGEFAYVSRYKASHNKC